MDLNVIWFLLFSEIREREREKDKCEITRFISNSQFLTLSSWWQVRRTGQLHSRHVECPHQFELSGFLVGKPAESNLNNTPLCLVSARASVVCPYVRRIFNVLFRLVTSFQMSCKPPAKEENRNGKKKHTQKLGKRKKTTNYNFHQWNEDNKNVHPFLFGFFFIVRIALALVRTP